MYRNTLYSIVFVSVILSITCWAFIQPADRPDDPSVGAIVINSFRWLDEGNRASIEVLEVNSSSGNAMRCYDLLLDETVITDVVVSCEVKGKDPIISPDTVFSERGTPFALIFYEREMAPGQDPGAHLELVLGEKEVDLTPTLIEAVQGWRRAA